MGVEFWEKVAVKTAFFVNVFIGSAPLKPKQTPPFSSLSSSAAPVSCPSFPPSPNPNDPVSFSVNFFTFFSCLIWLTEWESLLLFWICPWKIQVRIHFLFENPYAALFQSLLFEAVGRTVNPVSGAVGLLWTGNWNICQAAVETVLCGGKLHPLPYSLVAELDDVSESAVNCYKPREDNSSSLKRKADFDDDHEAKRFIQQPRSDLDLGLTAGLPMKRRAATPSEESVTTTSVTGSVNCSSEGGGERKLLRLFVWCDLFVNIYLCFDF